MSTQDLVVNYVLDKVNLVDGEKQYIESDVKEAIRHIYFSIYEGKHNCLLCVPKLEYAVYIKVAPITIINNDEQSIIKCIEEFDKAFDLNTINYSDTVEDYCNFIYQFYSTNSSNEKIKKRFDQSMNNYINIIVEKSLKNPDVCVEVMDGLKDAIRLHSSNKYANSIKGNISKRIYIHLTKASYSNDNCFVENANLLKSFIDVKHLLPDEFFVGFDAVNTNFVSGLNYIYKKCEKTINNVEWEAFKHFFIVLNTTKVFSQYKEYARKNIGTSSIADDRYRELIALFK